MNNPSASQSTARPQSGITLSFSGGAESVTGSNFLVQGSRGTLLVDCGVEQGKDACVPCMYDPFPYDVPSVDALVLTHAHLDHVGRAPKLIREGFKGTVYCTPPTADLMELILRDSARIMIHDAEKKGRPPMFSDDDVDAIMQRVKTIDFHKEFEAAPGLSCVFRNTGHILGSASVRIRSEDGAALALTGDIGNTPSPYLPDPDPITDAPVMVMESVYGNRQHTHTDDRVPELKAALTKAIDRGGAILIPAFSLERTQMMLYAISNLMDAGELPKIPVFLDSPLGIKATEVYSRWSKDYFKKEVQEELHREHNIFRFPQMVETPSREESETIAKAPSPKIIIAGAGMSHGGRIGTWERKYLPDPSSTLMIVGYQAPGSPGRLLQDGAKKIRLGDQFVPVKAAIETFSGWSAHADRDQLLAFAESCKPAVKTVFCALGEPDSARFLAQRVHDYLDMKAIVPTDGEQWHIAPGGAVQRVTV